MRSPRSWAAVALAAAGCAAAPDRLYQWHGYDDALYAQARAPQDTERYLERLRQIIERAEAAHAKAPPGVYAEYGYALFTSGQLEDAVRYYARERDTWPESRVFMEKMIRNTERLRESRPPAPGDGPPAPLPNASAETGAGADAGGGRP